MIYAKMFVCCVAMSMFMCASDYASGQDAEKKLLKSMEGEWTGSCKTWLRPGKLADESKITGTIKTMPGADVIRHTYKGTMSGKERSGEETIAFDASESEFQISWFDSFHMNYAMLFSRGKANKEGTGFAVSSKYRMSPKQKHWSWRTEYELKDADNLVITSYNITPDGQEGKAVELIYKRNK